MVMVADLGAAQAAEIFLRPIRAGAVERIGFLMVDALHFESARRRPSHEVASSALTIVPLAMRALIQELRRRLGAEHGRDRLAVALAHDDDDLALAVLVVGEAAINAVLGEGSPA